MSQDDLFLTTKDVDAETVRIAVTEALRPISGPGTVFFGRLRPIYSGYLAVAVYDEEATCYRILHEGAFGPVPDGGIKRLKTQASAVTDVMHSNFSEAGGTKRYGIRVVCAGPDPEVASLVGENLISFIKALVLAAKRQANQQ